jgi:hypothetical protein
VTVTAVVGAASSEGTTRNTRSSGAGSDKSARPATAASLRDIRAGAMGKV